MNVARKEGEGSGKGTVAGVNAIAQVAAAEQQAPVSVLEPQPEQSKQSTPIKKQHGGKRPGAGRKPDLLKRMIGRLKPAGAGELLAAIDVEATIAEIMKKGSLSLKQRTLADLMDRAWGRPAQALSVSGSVVHAHWTPGKYSHLTDEEFAKLAELSAKALGRPVSDTAPDGRGFQVESTSVRLVAVGGCSDGQEGTETQAGEQDDELDRGGTG